MAKRAKLAELTYSIISRLHNIGIIYTTHTAREDNYFIVSSGANSLLEPARIKKLSRTNSTTIFKLYVMRRGEGGCVASGSLS